MKVPILDPGGLFKDYELHKVTPVSCEIEDMDAISLNYWLTKFVMEVARDSGERYPPRTVYGIVCGVKRHLADKNGDEALKVREIKHVVFACLVLFISGIVLGFTLRWLKTVSSTQILMGYFNHS